jgi:protein TonB
LDISIKNSSISENTLIWAVVCSILLHLLLVVVIPNFKFDAIKKMPDELTIEIVQPKKLEAVVVPNPPKPVEEIKPVPIKPLQKKELTTVPKTIETRPEPAHTEPPPPPAVIAAAPKVDTPPVITVPPPEPPKKIEPIEEDINAALGQYGGILGRAIAKHKQYPKIAQMRGWQGDCMLDLKIDSSGNVLSANVKESSGHEALDNQALEMVRKAVPFPTPPEALRGRSFNISVPVSFKLE